MTEFKPFKYTNADVSALQNTIATQDGVINKLLKDMAEGKMKTFNAELGVDGYTITYRYNDDTTEQTLKPTDYLVEIVNTGDIVPFTAEEFERDYSAVQDPGTLVPDGASFVLDNTPEYANVNMPAMPVTIYSSNPIAQETTVTAKKINFDHVTIDSAVVKAVSPGEIRFEGGFLNGKVDKKTQGNAAIRLNTNDTVTVRDFKTDYVGYNCIEIGLNSTAPKLVDIDGFESLGTQNNNCILIFATADDAVVNIKNVHVAKCSNFLRMSNRTNAKNVTVNLENVVIDKVDSDPRWNFAMLFEDYTSESVEKEVENDLYAAPKITVNLKNVTVNGTKYTKGMTPAELWDGAENIQRFGHVDNDFGGAVAYKGNEKRYPIINVLE